MADKLLKSIKFPTLPDRYVIGDSTLTEEGAAADAKATGDEITNVKSATKQLGSTLAKSYLDLADVVAGFINASKAYEASGSWNAFKINAQAISLISKAVLYTNNTSFYAIAFYSSETISATNFISGVTFPQNGENAFYDIVVPESAVLAVISTRVATATTHIINCVDKSTLNTLISDIDSVNKKTIVPLSLSNCDYTEDGYISSDGSISLTPSWRTYMFDVSNMMVDSVDASVYSNFIYYNSISFYSNTEISAQNYISGIAPSAVGDSIINFTNIPIPNGTKLIAVSTRRATATNESATINVIGASLLKESIANNYSAGQLKAVYENLYIQNDITFVGEELWGGAIINDTTRINRYRLTDMGFILVGSIDTDFGHLNSMDYNEQNDCLIFGNGGNGFETEGNWFAIVKNPKSLGATATLAENAMVFNVDIGFKVQAVWGDSNLGLNNIVYLLSNDGKTITKALLGLNNSGEFDGTYTIVETKELDTSYFVGGCKFWGDTLYIGYADNTYKIAELSMTDYSAKVIHKHYYKKDGTELTGTTQGIHIDKDYLWLFINSTNPTNNYLIQLFR